MEVKNVLKELLSMPASPSGEEDKLLEIMLNLFSLKDDIKSSTPGSTILYKQENVPEFFIEAHIDQVSLTCLKKEEDNFFTFKNNSIRGQGLYGIEVIYNDKHGVITSIPPHLKTNTEEKLYIDMDEDIPLGASITFSPPEIIDNYVVGPGLDNRVGLSIALSLYMENHNIGLILTKREEEGLLGAFSLAVEIKNVFVIDATYGEKGIYKGAYTEINKGPVILIGAYTDRIAMEHLIEISKNIPLNIQIEPNYPYTGTDGDAFILNDSDTSVVILAYPLLNMHSAMEVVSLKDIEELYVLTDEFIKTTYL